MSTLTVGTISEKVTDAGVAVDGVTLKDGGATFTSAVTATDNTVDLGASSTRFKDLYLSGGAYIGGTGSANKLDDFEEGTFDLTVSDATSGGNTGSVTQNNFYTKIGDTVILNINLINITTTGLTGATNLYLQGSPFTPNSNSYGAGQAGVNLINVEASCFGLSMFINGGQSYLSLLQNLDDAGSGTTHVNKFNNGNADVFATVIFKV